jgi:hypothetical protein
VGGGAPFLPPPPVLGPNGLTPRWDFFCGMAVMTANECHQRATEAKALAVETQDLWEREMLFKIGTQWQLVAAHRAKKAQPVLKLVPGRSIAD